VRRAVVLGGTGGVGWAVTRRLLAGGWAVTVTGRAPERVPPELVVSGACFVQADRHDSAALPQLLGGGADLLVDCACYTAAQAEGLLLLLRDVTSTVMLSSKAVYVDAQGRHSNSDEPPCFDAPVTEDQPTLRPNGTRYDSREGYGPAKVAAEEVLLSSGQPVTVLRASKIHGAWSRQPREWHFVKRVLDRRPAVLLARGGRGADHPSAAVNLAALVERAADVPGRRVLNAADPDCPDGRRIAGVVAAHLGHAWEEVLLGAEAPAGLGAHPWDRLPPIVLDTSAANRLGYTPVGDYQATVTDELDWLVREAGRVDVGPLHTSLADRYGTSPSDYEREDAYLRARAG
jgi:nucleoside-diphosphate-sugar epimerase